MMPARRNDGFTLLELSIVLVIIALLAGAIVVGQDLIKASEVRATVTQVEKFRTATNTFNIKYGGLPGDLYYKKVQQLGFFFSGIDDLEGTKGFGDGNRLVENASGGGLQDGELTVYWRHLSDANLIEGRYGADLEAAGQSGSSNDELITYMPTASLGSGNFFMVYNESANNYYLLTGAGLQLASTGHYTATGRVTPNEAFNIDQKLDDGQPMIGKVLARGGTSAAPTDPSWSTATAASAVRGDCVTGGANSSATANVYALNAAAGKAFACRMLLRF